MEDTDYKNQPSTIEELKQVLVVLISISDETFTCSCEISDVGCRWSWTLMVHLLKVCLQDFSLPGSLNSDTEYDDACNVVRRL
jgi:hypothetical protein